MSTYSLSGSGTHALTAGTTGLQVTITTSSSIGGVGRSNPVAKYDQGLIRFSDGTSYWPPVAVLGGPQFIPVPANATSMGYALLGGAVISAVEVIGGTVFFSGGTTVLSGLSDVAISGASDGQVLEWVAAASKWENRTLPAGPTLPPFVWAQEQYDMTHSPGAASTSWYTRALNTLVSSGGGIASLSGNDLVLPAGTYDMQGSVPGFYCQSHVCRLFNVTDSTPILYGTMESVENSSSWGTQTRSLLVGRFTIAGTKTVRVQHVVRNSSNGSSAGITANSTTFAGVSTVINIATDLRLWQVA